MKSIGAPSMLICAILIVVLLTAIFVVGPRTSLLAGGDSADKRLPDRELERSPTEVETPNNPPAPNPVAPVTIDIGTPVSNYLSLPRLPLTPAGIPSDLTSSDLPLMYSILQDYAHRDRWHFILLAIAKLAPPDEAFHRITEHFQRPANWSTRDVLSVRSHAASLTYLGWVKSEQSASYLLDVALGDGVSEIVMHYDDIADAAIDSNSLSSIVVDGAVKGLIIQQKKEYIRPIFEQYVLLKSTELSTLSPDERLKLVTLEARLALYALVEDVGIEKASQVMSTGEAYESEKWLSPYRKNLLGWGAR